jgi:hypothetical protein
MRKTERKRIGEASPILPEGREDVREVILYEREETISVFITLQFCLNFVVYASSSDKLLEDRNHRIQLLLTDD